jgi:cytochrome c biogenesis protein CcmG, thiol:disulfide interchange protein DsbE
MRPTLKRLLLFIPFVAALFIGGFALWGLTSDRDPSGIPSMLISNPAPEFDLPPIPDFNVPGFAKSDLTKGGQPVVVNVFASWCVPCKAEHAVLSRLVKEKGVTLYGINYKNKAKDARNWLNDLGNPYARIGFDLSGRGGIEWGISGVPESFVVAGDGTVVFRYVGPMLGEAAQKKLFEALTSAGWKEPTS